ncbi:MAG: hypothetical protein QOC62_5754 [Mycobacterium sp.]|jgi:hypothetical protein|nr:hypothetical protein [Mycobacterium sp.]
MNADLVSAASSSIRLSRWWRPNVSEAARGPRPPLRPLPPEQQPATRGDLAAVLDELKAIRGVLEDIHTHLMHAP